MQTGFDHIDQCNPQLCIASKMMKMHRIVNNIFRTHLKQFDLTNSQLSMLFVITKSGGMPQKMLAEWMYMEKSTVSRNVAGLVKKGLVSTEEFPMIKMTQEGLSLLNEVIPQWDKAMAETREKMKPAGEEALDAVFAAFTG